MLLILRKNPKKKRCTIRLEISNRTSSHTKRIQKDNNAINVREDPINKWMEAKMKVILEDKREKNKNTTIKNQKIKTKTTELIKTTTIIMLTIPIRERSLTNRQFGY